MSSITNCELFGCFDKESKCRFNCGRHRKNRCRICNIPSKNVRTISIDVKCIYYRVYCRNNIEISTCIDHMKLTELDSLKDITRYKCLVGRFCSICRRYICTSCSEKCKLIELRNTYKNICTECDSVRIDIRNYLATDVMYVTVMKYITTPLSTLELN